MSIFLQQHNYIHDTFEKGAASACVRNGMSRFRIIGFGSMQFWLSGGADGYAHRSKIRLLFPVDMLRGMIDD